MHTYTPDRMPPRRILLATDLGPRSDRALDRAVQLARAWGAELIAATVVEDNAAEARAMLLRDPPAWYRAEDPAHQAERQLLQDAASQDVGIRVRVERGDDPAERLLALARSEGCGLIVAGVARHETLGRRVLGSTVDRLARRSPVPVLAVRGRAHTPYRRMAVTSDWSDSSGHALRTAMDLFPEATAAVLHGYEVPMAGLMDTARDEAIAQAGEQALADARAFLERCRPPAGADSVGLVVEHADPATLLSLYAEQYPVDLAVVASHGRGALFDMLLGSVAQRLLEASPVDTLIVGDPRAAR